MEKIFITGATGNVGKETIKKLIKNDFKDYQVIAGVRNINKAKKQLDYNKLTFRKFDFKDQSLFKEALKDIDKILLVRPPAISRVKKYILPFLKEVKNHSIIHTVFLSLQGVEKNPLGPHYRVEKYIKEVGLPYTFLRPSFFMQNLTTTHLKEIKENDEIFIPAGNGKTNFIDVRDIAEVAFLALTENGHMNKAYELTGKKALSYYEIANILTDKLNRKITYKDPSIINFYKRKKKEGMNTGKIIVMIGLYTVAKFGMADSTTNEINKLLNRDPISFSEFVEDHKKYWMKDKE